MSQRTIFPEPDVDTKPYFDACARHELTVQRCRSCGTILHLPRPMCFKCHSTESEWIPAATTGSVKSWTVVTHTVHPAFPAPYAVALVELDSPPNVHLVTNILECDPFAIEARMRVELVWEDTPDGGALPQFRPARVATAP